MDVLNENSFDFGLLGAGTESGGSIGLDDRILEEMLKHPDEIREDVLIAEAKRAAQVGDEDDAVEYKPQLTKKQQRLQREKDITKTLDNGTVIVGDVTLPSRYQDKGFEKYMEMFEIRGGKVYNSQQRELIKYFGLVDELSDSDPGSGKSTTMVGALVKATTFDGIRGDKICAVSYTREATAALKKKYRDVCARMRTDSNVEFRTFDSLCRDVVSTFGDRISLSGEKLQIQGVISNKDFGDFIKAKAEDHGFVIDDEGLQLYYVVRALQSLDSAFIYNQAHVESTAIFKSCNLTYEQLMLLRKDYFRYHIVRGKIPFDRLGIYALYILLTNEDVQEYYKNKYEVILVDEVQDMSLLKVRILSLLAKRITAIGDIKQSIYGFAGACPEVMDALRDICNTRVEVKLIQSYRCDNQIVAAAKEVVAPNRLGGEGFTGVDRRTDDPDDFTGVSYHDECNYAALAKMIHDEYEANHHIWERTHLFTYRNNTSAIPITEELFKLQVPIQMPLQKCKDGEYRVKYTMAQNIDVIREFCDVINFILEPYNLDYFQGAWRLFKELQVAKDYHECPLYKIMEGTDENHLEVLKQFHFENNAMAQVSLQALDKVKEALERGEPVLELFRIIYPIWSQNWYENKRRHLYEFNPQYYIDLVRPLIETKTFEQFEGDELRKVQFMTECTRRGEGVKCFTGHACKGDEATCVYILDAEAGILPAAKRVNDLMYKDCMIEAARQVRDDRNLVFVMMTRAMKVLRIYYRTEISPLLNPDEIWTKYYELDEVYADFDVDYDDLEVFLKMAQSTGVGRRRRTA